MFCFSTLTHSKPLIGSSLYYAEIVVGVNDMSELWSILFDNPWYLWPEWHINGLPHCLSLISVNISERVVPYILLISSFSGCWTFTRFRWVFGEKRGITCTVINCDPALRWRNDGTEVGEVVLT